MVRPAVGAVTASRSVAAVLAIFDISTGYQIVGLLHVLAVIVAFGPLFFYPSLQRAGAGADRSPSCTCGWRCPALALVWVLGMGLVGMSDEVWKMSQTWIVLSLIGWVILMLVSWFLIRPASPTRATRPGAELATGIGITHLLLVVMLYLMVFKPGL